MIYRKFLFSFSLLSLSIFTMSCGKETVSGDSAYNPDPIEVSTCSSSTGISKLICLADAFKGQLDATQLASVQRSYSLAEAQKWSNLPQQLVQSSNKRVGLAFSDMTSVQIQYAKALIKEAASAVGNEGWAEVQQIINADEYLGANGGGSEYGAGNYYIALLGTPSATDKWELQFGGHHLAFANTYLNGTLVGATPAFRSSEPFGVFSWNGTSNQPLMQEKDALSNMLKALSNTELSSAKLSSTFSDLLVGPQKDGQFPTTAAGIKVSSLNQTQKDLVMAAIATYVNDIAEADASSILAKYLSEIDDTYISYSGGTDLTTQNDYARIDGPSVWIEYSCQRGIILDPTHPHSVWRDKTNDYGGN